LALTNAVYAQVNGAEQQHRLLGSTALTSTS